MEKMPKWADALLVPMISLIIAFAISGLVILAIGESPLEALKLMVVGSLGSTYGWGYTLYYATNFMFTGLGVAVAFHAGLFNIGGEGQATLGGLGVAIACLMVPWPHWSLALLAAVVLSAAFGALWAALPAWLQAKRGSHIVITTIMFNFIAASLLNYLLVNVMRPAGSMDPASARFPKTTNLPGLDQVLGAFGIPFSKGT
ncbi:MAG: ABC transporter permease, partial [Paracoccaceae bacterium]|nr:ABC transporter permease [Paracoccaceae bacterium]